MQLYRDDAVVLRTQKLGEADRIITLLARKTGRVRAVAKGVRRTKSRFGARLEPFTHVDLMLYPGRSLDVITQAEVIRPYGAALTPDYPRYTAGVAMLETARFALLIRHDDAEREFAYDADAEVAAVAAGRYGWTVVSMKDDFGKVF